MKAAIWYGPGRENFRLEDLPLPTIEEPDDVLLRVRSVFYGAKVVRAITCGHPELKVPSIMGRMIAGDVIAVGTNIQNIKEGDRVTVDPDSPCGVCYYCRNLEPIHCMNVAHLSPGGMAEYSLVRGRVTAGIYPIPSGVSYDEAAFTETLACIGYSLLQANVIYGDTVVILGCGGVGLSFVQMARLRGATRIIVSGTHDNALAIARKLGTYTVNVQSENLQQIVKEVTDGNGADVVVEAVGKSSTYEAALHLVKPGGCIIAFGGCSPETRITISPNDIHYRSIKFVGTYHYPPYLFKRTLDLISIQAIDLQPILTHSLPLRRVSEAIDIYTKQDCRTLVLHPTE